MHLRKLLYNHDDKEDHKDINTKMVINDFPFHYSFNQGTY